jgi:mycothiol synthase
MNLPSGYEMRSPELEDAQGIADVLIATELDAFGEADTDANDITEDWAYEGFDRSTDAWVVTNGDAIVGYAAVFKKLPGEVLECYGGVHPDHVGRGLGSALVEGPERRARSYLDEVGVDAVTVQNFAIAVDEPGTELFRSRGYSVVRKDWSMQIDLTKPLKSFPQPEGIEVRTFRSGDEHVVHEMMETAFEDHWQSSPTSFDVWRARMVETPSFDPDLWLLAFEGDRLVGGSLNAIRVGRGYVNDLGVLREARKRGLAAHLLYRSFEMFKERGLTEAALFVDSQNPTGATRLYERVGMYVAREYELYGKEIRRTP